MRSRSLSHAGPDDTLADLVHCYGICDSCLRPASPRHARVIKPRLSSHPARVLRHLDQNVADPPAAAADAATPSHTAAGEKTDTVRGLFGEIPLDIPNQQRERRDNVSFDQDRPLHLVLEIT
jgi:hypothetical protein